MEVMIGLSIMSLLAIALVSILRTGNSDQKTLLGQDDARTLTANLAQLLSDPAACANTFGGLNPTVAGSTVDNLKDAGGTVMFKLGSTYANNTLQLDAVTVGGTGVDGKANIPKWVPASDPTRGIAIVTIDWRQAGNAGSRTGPAILQRYFLLDAVIDGAKKITGCAAEVGLATATSIGTGTTNFLPLWITSTTLGNSALFQSGSNVGLGTNTPGSALDVSGGVSMGTYAGSAPAPANSLIVSGSLGVKTPSPGSAVEVAGTLRLLGDATSSIGLRAPATVTNPVTWALPQTDGAPGQILSTTGSGQLVWADCTTALSACGGETINDCVLEATNSGGTSGTCAAGSTGACSFACDNGGWTEQSNSCVHACSGSGSETFAVPGTYTFTVPNYCTNLSVVARGGGGGGGGAYFGGCASGATSGGNSSFGGMVIGYGGGPGHCGAPGAGGIGGAGTGNSTAAGGNGADGWAFVGGTGGAGGGGGGTGGGTSSPCKSVFGGLGSGPGNGSSPGGGGGGYTCFYSGGGGGGGGYAMSAFPKGALTPGSTVTITVGKGGTGDVGFFPGGDGANGSVIINWN